MKNIAYKIMLGLIGVLFLVVGFNTYQLYWPIKVFDINSIKMITPQVKAGEDAIYHVDYCRYFEGNIHVFKSIDGPSLIYVPETVNANSAGCRTADVSLNIPKHTLPGTYVIKITTKAQVNSVRKVTIKYQTDSFEVYASTPSGGLK